MKKLFGAIALLAIIVSCGGEEKVEGWVINGSVKGIGSKKVYLSNVPGVEKGFLETTAVDDKFSFSGKSVNEPDEVHLGVDGVGMPFRLFIENGTINFEGEVGSRELALPDGETRTLSMLNIVKLEGTPAAEHLAELDRSYKQLKEENPNMTDEQITAAREKIEVEFIKKNPSAFYSGYLVYTNTYGATKEKTQELLAMLSSDIKCSYITDLRKKMTENVDVKVSEAITASNVSYKVDNKFDGAAFKGAKYLGVLKNGNLVALNNDKTIAIIDGNGKLIKSFAASTTAVPSTLAVDENDNIFVLVPEEKEVEVEYRGRKSKRKEIVAYSCDKYSADGNKLGSFALNGIKHATGARAASGKLMVADMSGRGIDIFNATTGTQEAEVKDMRPCCGILDFDVNDKNELLVANLGAFRVQKYDMTGKQQLAFGSRGEDVSAFHGCCNPVSVAYLSNGAIVTVEKDPTRVKVFSKEGAKVIAGIEEMVKGCSYIPMIVDGKDNLYLASPTKGIVRCVAI